MASAYRLDNVEVRPVERQVLVDGQPAQIGARAFDLLQTLLENPGRLITKSELLDKVWPGLVVEEANLHVQISSLRKLLGPKAIATIPGRGYRLAVEPARASSPSTQEHDRAPEATDAGPASERIARRHNLPEASESLIGREADVETLNRLLDQHRLVTVVGGSGVGKTRLAQAVALQRLSAHADGVWWVDLAVLRTPEQMAPAIAHAAGLALGDGDPQPLLRLALQARDTLLVLDNCEHLVQATAALSTTLLDAAPRLRLLATSLEPLKVRSEQVFRLEGLAVPPSPMSLDLARCFGAVQLLEHRAQAVDHRFRLTDAAADLAIDLCRQLDGIALAIEMAAARLPTLGLDQVHARLGDRLRLLRSSSRLAPARHQTLGATLEWSHAQLTPDEQAVLRRLAVFAGSFRLDSALGVVADDATIDDGVALDALSALVDKSLVQVVRTEPPRYRLLETTRLFAAQRLSESSESAPTLRRFSRALAAVAVQAESSMWDSPDRPWLERFMPDYDDLQAAFEHACAQHDAACAADLAAATAALDHVRGIAQGRRQRLAAAAALLPSAQGRARAKLLGLFATSYATTAADGGVSRSDAARELVSLYRELGDTQRLYEALGRYAAVAAMTGDSATAEQAIAEGRRLEQSHWPTRLRERFRIWLTGALGRVGDTAGYGQTVREILALAEQGGHENHIAMMQAESVDLALQVGDAQAAVEMGNKAMLSLYRLGMTSAWGMTAAYLCSAQALTGQPREARENACKAQSVLSSLDLEGLLFAHVALFCVRTGRFAEAARLVGCSLAWHAANRNSPDRTIQRFYGIVEAEVAAALGQALLERERADGQALRADAAATLLRAMIDTPQG